MDDDETDRLETILQAAEHNHQNLKDNERKFVADTRARYEEWGSNIRLSVKQWDWLESIFSRC